ncbi:MAG: virulence factor SrfB, partial [Myxococcota bacterium]
MVKKKVGLGRSSSPGARAAFAPPQATRPEETASPDTETLELFFNSGIIYHPLTLPDRLPDTIAGFIVDRTDGAPTWSFRKAEPAEDPDVEVSVHEHLSALSHRWLPVPYQLSAGHAVQVFLGTDIRGNTRGMLAIDTLESPDNEGRFLDRRLDAGRPYRALEAGELAGFLEHPLTQDLCRKLERQGVERAPFVLCALLERIHRYLPKICMLAVESLSPVDVSLVVDLGNSRSTAVLVEARAEDLFCIPLELRHGHNPFEVSDEPFDSRCTFIPSAFEESVFDVAVGDGFQVPSIARLGREALDRALETPHRYLCSLSGPKRYLWDDEQSDDRWYFAYKSQEHQPIFGRLLKYLVEGDGGLTLRRDGPSTPADPRYAPRTMMLFAIAEIVTQAMSQINSVPYRRFQGKEGRPRVLKHMVMTYPSGMPDEEKQVYERLVQNAVTLVSYLLNLDEARRPNFTPGGSYAPFLFADEALAAQMVFVYEEVAHRYQGSFEGFAGVYGREGRVRVASVDIGGGTTDVMIADYGDQLAGSATSLTIEKRFQDGVSIAGDEVCRAIVEDIVFPQILSQLESPDARAKLVHLFTEGDAGFGASWRTLKAKSVPYLWVPLARAYWALAE